VCNAKQLCAHLRGVLLLRRRLGGVLRLQLRLWARKKARQAGGATQPPLRHHSSSSGAGGGACVRFGAAQQAARAPRTWFSVRVVR
jgi:hypothetical protein